METIDIMEAVSEWTGEERLQDLLNNHYGLNLIKAKPVGGVLKVRTNRGSFALKRVRQGEKSRWRMLKDFKKHLENINIPVAGFPIQTRSDKSYFTGFNHPYVLIPWIKAKNVSLNRKVDWQHIATTLAHLHMSSKDFSPKIYHDLDYIGKWKDKWEREIQLSEIFHLAAKWTMMPTEADKFWLRTASYTTSIMENLMEYYGKIDGDEACEASREHGGLCHGNLHRSNMLQTYEGQVYFIDWNEAVINVRAHDIANLLLHAYGKTGSTEVLKAILSSYQNVSKLKEEEYSLIYARLLYPERLMRTLQSIYEKDQHEEHHDVAAGVIKKLTKVEEKKVGLLKAYATLVKEEYQVTIPVLDWLTKVEDEK